MLLAFLEKKMLKVQHFSLRLFEIFVDKNVKICLPEACFSKGALGLLWSNIRFSHLIIVIVQFPFFAINIVKYFISLRNLAIIVQIF